MNFKIGNYVESKMKNNHITKVKLHEQIKEMFHPEENYISYKGFATRFYTKFYAEDLLKISYLLGIDLNKMRDEIVNSKNNNELLDLVLSNSKYAKICSSEYSKWFDIEDGIIYVVWFKQVDSNILDYMIEMYDLSERKITDITFLTYKAILGMEKELNNKALDDKLKAIKSYNKKVYNKIKIEMDSF